MMSFLPMRFVLLTFLISVTGCPALETPEPTCLRNSDCLQSQICVAGLCTVECVEDRDCSEDKTCQEGQCLRVATDAGATPDDGFASDGGATSDTGTTRCTTRCPDGDACVEASDCLSGVCTDRVCAAPRCDDATQNGDEMGVDCGGLCDAGCPDGDPCLGASDCLSGVCTDRVCAAPRCDDATQNGDEMGVDCGGLCDAGCPDGDPCVEASDCLSGVCTDRVCAVPRCDDDVRNGSESDVDCGQVCQLCNGGDGCESHADCVSFYCIEGVCTIPDTPITLPEDRCGAGSLTGTGQLGTNLVPIVYEGQLTTAESQHGVSVNADDDGCIASARFRFSLFEGRGCRLSLDFRSDDGGRLLLRSAQFEADGFCPDWPNDQRGTYNMLGGAGTIRQESRIPGEMVDSGCSGPHMINFMGTILMHSEGNDSLLLELDGLGVDGNVLSVGDPDLLCPGEGVCGDGILDPGEGCDDGPEGNNDQYHCLNNCQVARCGDGERLRYSWELGRRRVGLNQGDEGYEECDDGNQIDEDSCINCRHARCRDGFHNLGDEECDDGNHANDDGCVDNCRLARCGDGFIRGDLEPGEQGHEECEDRNRINDDGCTNECQFARCGDGIRRVWYPWSRGEEVCDDGNDEGGDDCNNDCQPAGCGDGFLRRFRWQDGERVELEENHRNYEVCDDGGADDYHDRNTCSDNCRSVRQLWWCGDGVQQDFEDCDDGNLINGDGCNDLCRVEPSCEQPGPPPANGILYEQGDESTCEFHCRDDVPYWFCSINGRQMNWHSARRECRAIGMHLVTISSPEENQFVHERTMALENGGPRNHMHIGTRSENPFNGWRWDSGLPMTYENWVQGHHEGYCAYLIGDNDDPCCPDGFWYAQFGNERECGGNYNLGCSLPPNP